MCTSPKKIRTPKKVFNADSDPLYYMVPCNHCAQCVSAKVSAWSLRSYYEWKYCKDNGGVALYITLTYAPNSLPYCDLPTVDGDSITVPCFCKRDIQNFLMRLRKYCQRHYDCDVRYIVTSEYGGEKHRPHYHGVLFFSKNLYSHVIKGLVRNYWSFGFVNFGKKGGIVNSPAAALYVTKYIAKDFDFLKLLTKIGFNKDTVDYEVLKSYRRMVFPFHLQSVGFGASLIDYNDFDIMYDGKCLGFDTKTKTEVVVTLPQYHVRKLFYELDENKSYVPTELGKKMLQDRRRRTYQENIERLSLQIQSYIDLVQHVFQDSDILEICRSLGMPASRSCIISSLNKIQYAGIDKFYEYITNLRFYLRVSDVGIPHSGYLSAVERVKRRYDPALSPSVSASKYVDIHSISSSQFLNLTSKTFSATSSLEPLAHTYEAIRDYIAVLANIDYDKYQEEESKNKLLIEYDNN